MLIVQNFLLQFQVLNFFVLFHRLITKTVHQLFWTQTDFAEHVFKIEFGGFLQIGQLSIKLILLFSLNVNTFFEMVNGDLEIKS